MGTPPTAHEQVRITPASQEPRFAFYRPTPAGVSIAAPRRQLGILSGAFNPITVAHVALARSAYHQYRLHEILLLLPITQPHKQIVDAPIDDRLRMMALAVQDDPGFSIGSCTHGLFIDICRAVEVAYVPQTQLCFITGRDAAERVLTWPYSDPAEVLGELFARAELLVAEREGKFILPEIPSVRAHADRIHDLPLPSQYSHVAATDIRARLARGEDVSAFIPPAVLAYIQARRLYQEVRE